MFGSCLVVLNRWPCGVSKASWANGRKIQEPQNVIEERVLCVNLVSCDGPFGQSGLFWFYKAAKIKGKTC